MDYQIEEINTDTLGSRFFKNVHGTKDDKPSNYGLDTPQVKCCICRNAAAGYNHMISATDDSVSINNAKTIYLVPGCQPCNMSKVNLELKQNRIIYKRV